MAQYSRKSWKDTLNKFVLKYRFTPPKITQCVPSYIIFLYKFKTDILAFEENQQKSHRKTLNELDKQQKEKSKQSTDSKRKCKPIHISKNGIVLAKYIHPKNKVSTYYEPNLYIATKVHKKSARIKSNKGEHVRGKVLKVT